MFPYNTISKSSYEEILSKVMNTFPKGTNTGGPSNHPADKNKKEELSMSFSYNEIKNKGYLHAVVPANYSGYKKLKFIFNDDKDFLTPDFLTVMIHMCRSFFIKSVIFAKPYTIIIQECKCKVNNKVIVKCSEKDIYDPMKGFFIALSKLGMGTKEYRNIFNNISRNFSKIVPTVEKPALEKGKDAAATVKVSKPKSKCTVKPVVKNT